MKQPLPTGCHDIKTAAELLGMSAINLYKKLRKLGWLHSGTYRDDPTHNTPRHWAITAGLVTTQQRGYPAPYNKNVAIMYNTTLLTGRGFKEAEKILTTDSTSRIASLNVEIVQHNQLEKPNAVQHKEREKCLNQLREMGIFTGKSNC